MVDVGIAKTAPNGVSYSYKETITQHPKNRMITGDTSPKSIRMLVKFVLVAKITVEISFYTHTI